MEHRIIITHVASGRNFESVWFQSDLDQSELIADVASQFATDQFIKIPDMIGDTTRVCVLPSAFVQNHCVIYVTSREAE